MGWIARLLALAALTVASSIRAAEESVAIELETPLAGEATRGVQGMGFLGGRVLGQRGDLDLTDLMILIDVSASTSYPSGGDIDGDGRVRGMWKQNSAIDFVSQFINLFGWLDDATDTILAAEISAARQLLDQLDPRITQVGALTFSGDLDETTLDASVIAPLTDDYAEVRRVLDAALLRGANGRTNILAAISLATVELTGTRSAKSTPRDGARKVALLFSDGRPTLPLDASIPENTKLTVEAARRAARSGIRIRSYGVGTDADAECLSEVARVSQGTYVSVIEPSALRAEVAKVDLREVAELEIQNLVNGERADRIVRSPDGNFFALLPMQPGRNEIQITARTSGGSAQKRFEVEFREDGDVAAGAPRDATQARMRSELFSGWLAERAGSPASPESAPAP